MAEPKHADADLARQIGEMWGEARAELIRLREMVERAVNMGNAQVSLTRAKGERDVSLARLGEGLFKLVDGGQLAAPAPLKRLFAEVKAKDVELIRQQADIAAILKEADALAEKSKKTPVRKKR